MATSIKPIFYKSLEVNGYLDNLSDNIKQAIGKESDLLLDHPGVYVHVWQSKYDFLNGQYSIYIGETNDIVARTKEHWGEAYKQSVIPKNQRSKGQWQYHMLEDVDINGKTVVPTVYFFGHKYFHKSITLDLENRLIDYCMAMPTAHIYNGRTNPQGNYSGDDNLDSIFSMIWSILRQENNELFMSETDIIKSAIYKASPNHKLTIDQKNARQIIIDRVTDAIINDKKEQLIFVEGEAGTGKTVLTNSTFYGILESDFLKGLNVKACMLINHEEQRQVYENIARKLGYNEDIIQHPSTFLWNHSILDSKSNTFEPNPNDMMDIVFVDEAHLLWDQRNQKYDNRFKYSQLDEIMKRSRITVIMYDENQVLHRGQVTSFGYMSEKRELAKKQGPNPKNGYSNYIELNNQLRMQCSHETMKWVDDFSKDLTITKLKLNSKSQDSKGYEVVIFDDPSKMHQEIKNKAAKDETKLSRIVADFEWEYKNSSRNGIIPWMIYINDWSIPWNEEIFHLEKEPYLSSREAKKYKVLDWAEKDTSLDEAGSTFTIQGFDLSYVGVILGPAVKYDSATQKVFFDYKNHFRPSYMKGKRIFGNEEIDVTNLISQHELRVLLTRGTKGLYIYAADNELRKALFDSMK